MKTFITLFFVTANAWKITSTTIEAYTGDSAEFNIELEDEPKDQATSFCVIQNDYEIIDSGLVEQFTDGDQSYNCSVFNFNPTDSKIIPALPTEAGYHRLKIVQITMRDETRQINGSDFKPINIRVLRAQWIYVLDQIIGWLYFLFWSISFYPQVIMNYRRQSVVGFNMDFLGYDLAGFFSFTLYNCLIFWSPSVFNLYLNVYPGASNPIQINDVFFCLHAVVIQLINSYQCFTYERAGQGLSKSCKGILIGVSIAVLIELTIAGTGAVATIGWFQVLTFASYIKVGSSVIKYMPQVYLNWKRKCTLGFAIDMAIMDISGGTACYLQTVVQYINSNDIAIVSGNIGKIGIGFVSCFFDVILLMQHFCLYGKNNHAALLEMEKETDEKSPFVSQQFVSQTLGSRQGFSPTTSAVLYHAPKGDLLASTASFRDVFTTNADVHPNQAWTNVMESVTGSRAFGHNERVSISTSKGNIVASDRRF